MITRLYVSPHLDDAALSCAGAILDARARGERVIVATLFSRGDAARNDEDRAAWDSADVEVRHLDLEDAPYRLGRALTFRALMLGPPPDASDVARAEAVLERLLRAESPDEVWFPLGVGGHVDHEVAYQCHHLAADRARFYVDRPYGFVRALRDARLGVGGGALPRDSTIEAELREVRLMDGFFVPGERAACVAEIAERVANGARAVAVSPVNDYCSEHLEATARLIGYYRSQVRWIFGDEPVLDAYRRLACDANGRLIEGVANPPRSGLEIVSPSDD